MGGLLNCCCSRCHAMCASCKGPAKRTSTQTNDVQHPFPNMHLLSGVVQFVIVMASHPLPGSHHPRLFRNQPSQVFSNQSLALSCRLEGCPASNSPQQVLHVLPRPASSHFSNPSAMQTDPPGPPGQANPTCRRMLPASASAPTPSDIWLRFASHCATGETPNWERSATHQAKRTECKALCS